MLMLSGADTSGKKLRGRGFVRTAHVFKYRSVSSWRSLSLMRRSGIYRVNSEPVARVSSQQHSSSLLYVALWRCVLAMGITERLATNIDCFDLEVSFLNVEE